MNVHNTCSPLVIATSKYLRMSPIKVRRVVNQVRGRSYEEALLILEFMPYFCCKPILQVLRSAGANAEHNFGLKKHTLMVNEIYANAGPVLKRFRPRAQGRGYKIQKPTCHIRVGLLTIRQSALKT